MFIIGCERSGTTLLMSMLNCHSKIAIPYESHFIISYYNKLAYYNNLNNDKDKYHMVSDILQHERVIEWDKKIDINKIDYKNCNNFSEIINAIYDEYARLRYKQVWGDKTPLYSEYMDIINKLFPDSKFIHIIRDGRDVALSLKKLWYQGQLLNGLDYWCKTAFLAHKMGNMLPTDRYYEIHYESLVTDPRLELKGICSFLNIEYEDEMLRYHNYSEDYLKGRINSHHKNLKLKPMKNRVYIWKKELGFLEKQLISYMYYGYLSYFNYETTTYSKHIIFYKYYYIIKEGIRRRKNKIYKYMKMYI